MTTAKRKPRPQGQWLVDGTDPLNDDERIKQEDPGIAVMSRVRETYSKQGFASIPPEDLAPRLKWVGMYTQRKQGLDGTQTSTLSNAELQDNYFMMRIRLDGGQVAPRVCAPSEKSPVSSHVEPRTSPTGKTCSCTGLQWKTFRRSGTGWQPWAWTPASAVAMFPA